MSNPELGTYPTYPWMTGPVIPKGDPCRLQDLKRGHRVFVCEHWGCIRAGTVRKVFSDSEGLFLRCDDGKHYLDGQEDERGGLLADVRLLNGRQ